MARRRLRRVLGVLRESEHAQRVPQPDLAAVADLIGDGRAAGLDCHLHHEGHPVEVPQSTGLSAFRIVQEAMTNARRHAGQGARVDVILAWDASDLTVTVRDGGGISGQPPPQQATAGQPAAGPDAQADTDDVPGLGLLGMRERAAIAGGTLQHGQRSDGGFEVCARLPLQDGDAAADADAAAAVAGGAGT